jgi:hypothetical protein
MSYDATCVGSELSELNEKYISQMYKLTPDNPPSNPVVDTIWRDAYKSLIIPDKATLDKQDTSEALDEFKQRLKADVPSMIKDKSGNVLYANRDVYDQNDNLIYDDGKFRVGKVRKSNKQKSRR